MPHLHPANIARHDERDFGQRAADKVSAALGSWKFIISQTVFIVCWITLNVLAIMHHWDPYPFILLNLAFSTQAAYAAPLIQLSQNRQTEHDRTRAEHDYVVNQETRDISRETLNILKELKNNNGESGMAQQA